MDRAIASKNEKLIILALDWAKAFDSISPESLYLALLRFGVPDIMVHMIGDIYSNRIFRVQLQGYHSGYHT